MKKFFEKIKDFFFNAVFGIFWGFIFGLMVAMAIFAARHKPFWCLGFTFFFLLFHLSDFQTFFKEKNWMAIIGRFIALFAITASIVSLFVFALGAFGSADIFDGLTFLLLIPLGILVGLVWSLLQSYGRHTVFYREFEKVIDGLHVLGVFWRY